jgi:hypothetical protein
MINKILFRLGAFIVVFLPVPLTVFSGSATVGAFCFISGTLAVLFSKLDVLDEFSLGPLKAKLRIAIDEANATVDQLRSLGCELSDAILSQLVSSEMQGMFDSKAKYALRDRIVACLRTIGANEQQRLEAQHGWRKGISMLYLQRIDQSIMGNGVDLPSKSELAASDEISSVANRPLWDVPSPERIRSILERHSVSKATVDNWLNEYERFLQTSEILDIDNFLSFNK